MNRFVLGGASAIALLLAVPSLQTFHAQSAGPAAAFAADEGHGSGGSGGSGGHESGGGSGGGGGGGSGGHESGGGCSGGGCSGGADEGGGKMQRGQRGGPMENCPFGDKSGRGRYASQRQGHNTGHEGGQQEGTTEEELAGSGISGSGITGGGQSGESFVCDGPGNWNAGNKIFRK